VSVPINGFKRENDHGHLQSGLAARQAKAPDIASGELE